MEIWTEFGERLKRIEARLTRIEGLLLKNANGQASHQDKRPKTSAEMELLTVPQFSQRVGRNRQTVYFWIRSGKMSSESVVMVQGSLRINWPVYQQSIRSLNGGGNGVEDVRWPDS